VPFIDSVGSTQIRSIDGEFAIRTGGDGGSTANTTERLRIGSSGAVGIGTSSPRSILDLDGGSETQLRLQTTNSGSTTGDGLLISLDSSANAKSYIWNYENAEMIFGTYNTERMRITSAGNVGIGTTPSSGVRLDIRSNAAATLGDFRNASSTGYGLYVAAGDTNSQYAFRAADYQNNALVTITGAGNLLVGKTSTGDYVTGIEMQPAGAILSYRTGGVASIFGRTDNGEITRFTRNGSIVGAIGARTSSELYIDLGSTGLTGSSTGGGALLPTSGGTSYTDASVDLGFSSGRFRDLYLSSKVRLQYPGNSYYARVEVDSSTNLIFGAGPNGSERAKITSAGNLLVGRTSAGATGNGHSIRGGDSAIFSRDSSGESMIVARNSSTGDIVRFYSGGVDKGSINFDGGSTISYTSGSDQRLKENIVDAPSASNDIDDLQVRSFDWKSNGAHQKYGMIAQEMQTVAPEAVWAPADPDEMMGVDYSKLVPMLVKEIQSLRARVAQLENN
jgi:hypothetical protein